MLAFTKYLRQTANLSNFLIIFFFNVSNQLFYAIHNH